MEKPQRKPKPRGRRDQPKAGLTLRLDIRDMAAGGYGLARARGKTIFVPYTVPGESISARITGERGKALLARGLRLHAASRDRVAPRCPHFGDGRCWGCQWQHIAYPAQLLLKQDVLADQLSRLGKLPDALIEATLRAVLPNPEPWGYSHSLSLRRDRAGRWGLRRQDGGIEAIADCPVARPELLALLARLDLDYPSARQLTLRRGTDGRLMLIFHVDAEIAPSLQADLSLSVNLILPDREPVNLIGDAHSRFTIGGRVFRVTAGSSMRDNIAGVERLVELAAGAARLTGRERVLDLYAGVGVFSAFLAASASVVTVVESYPPAANDAQANLADCDNVDLVEGGVEAVLEDMAEAGARYDVALVDPPSRGLTDAVVRALRRLRVRRVVYVSGDPASLARDCRRLIDAGFRLREIQPLDLSPQTYYITAVGRFER